MPAKNIPKKRLISIFPEFSPLRVKYKDVFDIKSFYEELREWFREHGWADAEDKLDKWERFYGERVGKGGAKEIWIRWRVFKPAEGARLTYYIDVDFHALAIVPTEIVKDGRKIKAQKGELELSTRAFIEENYKEDFEKHGFLRHIIDIFSERIYKKTIEQRRKELYQEAYVLQTYIKQWFKLKSYLPYEEKERFFKGKSWPSHLK